MSCRFVSGLPSSLALVKPLSKTSLYVILSLLLSLLFWSNDFDTNAVSSSMMAQQWSWSGKSSVNSLRKSTSPNTPLFFFVFYLFISCVESGSSSSSSRWKGWRGGEITPAVVTVYFRAHYLYTATSAQPPHPLFPPFSVSWAITGRLYFAEFNFQQFFSFFFHKSMMELMEAVNWIMGSLKCSRWLTPAGGCIWLLCLINLEKNLIKATRIYIYVQIFFHLYFI